MLTCYSTYGVDRPLFSAGALASNVAAKIGTAVFSMVTSFWGSARADKDKIPPKRVDLDLTSGPLAALPHELSLVDPRRQITALSFAPTQVCE
jgi:hypothetical protein